MFVVQAKDKAHWQKLFSHFCSRTANEEEEIAHKLLGEKFRVSYQNISFCLKRKNNSGAKSHRSKTISCSYGYHSSLQLNEQNMTVSPL